MARIQIDFPERFSFQTTIQVRISDLNYGGHVGNDSMLTLMQEARMLYYTGMGFKSELNLEGNVGQIIADAVVVYKSEAFFGDVLLIEIAVGEITRYGFDLFYRLSQHASGKHVAYGKTRIVCFDYEKRKVAGMPATLLERLKI